MDDEICMDFTLSQPSGATTARDRRVESLVLRGRSLPSLGHCLAIAILLAMTGAFVGCDSSNAVGAESGSLAGADVRASSAQEEAPAPFVWPDDPGHPMLSLEIDSDPGRGTIKIELMPELAPATVAHVIELAEQNYYDGTTFHRVIPGFMIQGGDPNSRDRDPNNDGQGNAEISIADEFGPAPFVRGVVGMGNKGHRNSTGGQFFIMHADNRNLDGRYTVIGRVTTGMDVVDAIMGVSIDRIGRWGPKDRPIENVVMKTVALESRQGSEAHRATSNDAEAAESAENPSANSLADL